MAYLISTLVMLIYGEIFITLSTLTGVPFFLVVSASDGGD